MKKTGNEAQTLFPVKGRIKQGRCPYVKRRVGRTSVRISQDFEGFSKDLLRPRGGRTFRGSLTNTKGYGGEQFFTLSGRGRKKKKPFERELGKARSNFTPPKKKRG